MNDKNMKKTKIEAKHSAEDIQLYRLFCIFGAAILGFALFRMVPYNVFSRILGVGQWVALALCLATIGVFIYFRVVKKLDESSRIVTIGGIAYFLIPIFLLLACYRSISNPEFKCQVAFGFVALYAVIYNIFKKNFCSISATTFLAIIALYYASRETYNTIENVIAVVAMVAIFVLPVALAAKVRLDIRAKNEADRFDTILTHIMCALLLVCAVITLINQAIFSYILISILVVYVIIGIVCTIRMI